MTSPARSTSARRPSASAVPGSGRDAPDHTVDLCSGCGICTRACPAGVLIAETNNRARAAIVEERGSSFRNRIISDTDLIARFGVPLAPLANIGLKNRIARWMGEKVLGVHRRGPLTTFSRRPSRPGGGAAVERPTCIDRAGPRAHGRLLPRLRGERASSRTSGATPSRSSSATGSRVIVPRQECCGLPVHLATASTTTARRKARRNLAVLAAVRAGRLPDRRHLDLVHPRAQGRVPRDARPRRRRCHRRRRCDLGHLRAAARPPRPRRARHAASRRSSSRCRTTRPAS